MNWDAMQETLEKISKVCKEFADQYEEEIIELIRKENADPEECLQQELVFELLDHVNGIVHMEEYLKKPVVKEGVLSLSEDGDLLLDGERVPMMKEIEVFYFNEECGHEVWTKTYSCGAKEPHLIGLKKSVEINGMRARIRE